MSGPFDWEQEDKAMMSEWHELQARDAAEEAEYDPCTHYCGEDRMPEECGKRTGTYPCPVDRDEDIQLLEAEERMAKEEGEWVRQMAVYAQFCPRCGRHCGTPDFEPDDPSVGILGVSWCGECPDHGVYVIEDTLAVRWDY